MPNQTLRRLFRAIPFPMACELHQRLRSGEYDQETKTMLRKAMRMAGFARRAAA